MDKALTLSVVAGMSIGIILVIVFASSPTTDSNSFSPGSYYDWSPSDGGLPRVILTEDVDAGGDQVPTMQFGYELQLTSDESALKPIYPQVTVVNEKISSLQGTILAELAKTSTSETIERSDGTSKSMSKDGQAELTALHGVDSAGQDIIAATLTNTGTTKIYVASFLINGATSSGLGPLSAYAIDDDYSPEVWGNIQKPVITEPMLLNPGESVTAHITGKWNIGAAGNEAITTFSVGAGYTYDPSATEYKEGNNWSISIPDFKLP